MVNDNSEDNFQTHETEIAAFLIAIGGAHLNTAKLGKHYTFFFELTPEQKIDILHYKDGTRLVSALVILKAYQGLIRDIKNSEEQLGSQYARNR